MRTLLPLLLLASACSEHGFSEVKDYGGVYASTISGRVCDPDRNVWLEGAIVYTHIITPEGDLVGTVETVTDADGYYLLDELRGDTTYTVYIQYGSEVIDMFDVPVEGTEDVVLPDPACQNDAVSSVAVVTGDFDAFGDVLTQLGFAGYDEINGRTGDELAQFLSQEANLEAYDAIFFAGGHLEEDVFYDLDGDDVDGQVDAVLAALRGYVGAGGVIVASDWSYDVVERAWPDKVDFLGDDDEPDAAQLGTPTSVDASVTQAALQEELGEDTVNMHFDLDAWPVMESASTDVTVYQMADVPWAFGMDEGQTRNAPLYVSFEEGSGKVIYTSWRLYANMDGKPREVIQFLVNRL